MNMNRFKMNHVGYRPAAAKRFAYNGEATEFTVDRMQDCLFTPVYTGELVPATGSDIALAKNGDFSALAEPGIYRLRSSEGNSRVFIISDEVYDTAARIMSGYFTWQRSADDLGWRGNYHADDKIDLASGESRSLAKGHNQSSDLRKLAWGTSMGIHALAEYGLAGSPHWDDGLIARELRHSCDYYVSLIAAGGFVMDSSFIPEEYDFSRQGLGYGDYQISWRRRRYYEKPSSAAAQWNTLRALAISSLYLKERDPQSSARYLDGAKAIWGYMDGAGAAVEDYDLYEYPPIGLNGIKRFFDCYYPGSAIMLGSRAMAAEALWRCTGAEEYRQAASESLRLLLPMQIGGEISENLAAACFYEGDRGLYLANNSFYFYYISIPSALAGALELWPDDLDASRWLECADKIARQALATSAKNPFGRLPSIWNTVGHNRFAVAPCFSFSTTVESAKSQIRPAGRVKFGDEEPGAVYDYTCFCNNLSVLAGGVFLQKMAGITGRSEYAAVAQRQLDWIMGQNNHDSSHIEAVGYNQPHRGVFGEYFPPTPQIPGAVFCGVMDSSYLEESYGLDCEYDMPMVGWAMHLISEINAQGSLKKSKTS